VKGGAFGSGPIHANGTRVFWRPGDRTREVATGQATPGKHLFPKNAGEPPDFAGAGSPCTRPDADPELWHPNGTDDEGAQQAIALCNTCHMRDACLVWARQIKATSGIWGGVWLDQPKQRGGKREKKAS
jgi:WhiB family redox-sensing transcriptional regulator